MESPLNNTQSAPDTGNPQSAAPSVGASNGASFQSTAPPDTLNQQQAVDLNVQSTGEPLPAQPVSGRIDGAAWAIWIGLLIVGVGLIWAIRTLLNTEDEPAARVVSAPAPATDKTIKKPVKKTVKKTKAGKPVKKRKNTARKRH